MPERLTSSSRSQVPISGSTWMTGTSWRRTTYTAGSQRKSMTTGVIISPMTAPQYLRPKCLWKGFSDSLFVSLWCAPQPYVFSNKQKRAGFIRTVHSSDRPCSCYFFWFVARCLQEEPASLQAIQNKSRIANVIILLSNRPMRTWNALF